MNLSPHHQRPTRYPWPGRASAAMVVVGIAVVLLIGYLLITGSAPDDAAPDPTGSQEMSRAA